MGNRNLAAVGEAGFLRGAGLALDDRDLVAGLPQEPCGSGAYDARTQNNDVHPALPVHSNNENCMKFRFF